MCKTSSKTQTNTVDPAISASAQGLAGAGQSLFNNPRTPPTQGTAGFVGDQTNAFQQLRNLISGAPQIGGTAINDISQYAGAGPQSVTPGQVSTGRVVDQNGRLGAFSDYLDPEMAAANGPLQGALRTIQEQSDQQRKANDARATAAGAFGDARSGVQQAMLGRDTSLAMGETARKAYQDAYDRAIAQRTGDINRFVGVDTGNVATNLQGQLANAGFNEQALQRLFTGGQGLEGVSQADQARLLQQVQSLLGTGQMQQSQAQNPLNALFASQMLGYQQPIENLGAWAQALGATRGNANTTSTLTQPDNSILGGVGSGLGSWAGSTGGSNLLASWLSSLGGAGGAGAEASLALGLV